MKPLLPTQDRRLVFFRNCVRRCATTYRAIPVLWVHEAERALRLWYGGFWRSIFRQVCWHLRLKWACDWCPTALAQRAWFRWHAARGHFRTSDGYRHWHTCCLPDDFGLDVPDEEATEADLDNCIEDAMPRWMRPKEG